jgi:antitoxin (DNA-binding transcriptional repressor) of toxin-antitoxin stability system
MDTCVPIDDAMTRLADLVNRVVCGREIVILKDGVACVKLVAVAALGDERKPATALKVSFIAGDFDAMDEELVGMFGDLAG